MRLLVIALMTFFAAASAALAQSNPCNLYLCSLPVHYLSAASTNSTNVKASPSALYGITVVNTTATIYYLKFYDKASAPTCNSDTVKMTIPVPASTSGGAPVVVQRAVGIGFSLGLGFCLTGGIADSDNTNAATGVAINLDYR